MNQIINIFIRILMRKGINAGIKKGVDLFSRKKTVDPSPPETRQAGAEPKKNTKQTMRTIRRTGRF